LIFIIRFFFVPLSQLLAKLHHMGGKHSKGLWENDSPAQDRCRALEGLNRQLEYEIADLKEKLAMANKSAEEYQLLKSNFISNISHEMRTPLNAIVGFSELPFMGDVDLDEVMEYMQVIRKSSRQLLDKIKNIIFISNLDSDDIPVILELVSVKRIFSEIKDIYKDTELEAGQSAIDRLSFIYPEEDDIFAKTDFEKIKQVLQQLINNALKFSHHGTVEVGCKKIDENNIECYVSDTGIGVPEDKKEIVFDLFRMVDESPGRQYGGSGLGLYIVKRVLSLLNIPVHLKSEVGVGTRVSFTMEINS